MNISLAARGVALFVRAAVSGVSGPRCRRRPGREPASVLRSTGLVQPTRIVERTGLVRPTGSVSPARVGRPPTGLVSPAGLVSPTGLVWPARVGRPPRFFGLPGSVRQRRSSSPVAFCGLNLEPEQP
jgi:hypothetical protein